MVKKLMVSIIAGILVFLILGWGYNIFIGKPITLSHYFSDNQVSYMKIGFNNGKETVKTKELTNQELEDFIKKFGSYKIFKPFFRRTMIGKQNKNNIGIVLSSRSKSFSVAFPLTDTGEINLIRYTFYPYQATHIDMYHYLLDLLYLE
jgi:hypothetical protein